MERGMASQFYGPSSTPTSRGARDVGRRNTTSTNCTPSTPYELSRAPPGDMALGQVLQAISGLVTEVKQHNDLLLTMAENIRELRLEVAELQDRVTAQSRSKDAVEVNVPTSLKKSVRSLHKSYREDKQFEFADRYDSSHNSTVFTEMQRSLLANGQYEEAVVQRAIKGFFESSQRMQRGYSEKQTKAKKSQQRKKRLLERRERFLSPQELEEWRKSGVGWQIMSDEDSDSEDKRTLVIHSPQWRDEEFTSFLQELDKREAEERAQSTNTPASKPRKRGETVFCLPPKGTNPSLVNPEFKLGYCGIPSTVHTFEPLDVNEDLDMTTYDSSDDSYNGEMDSCPSEPDEEYESECEDAGSNLNGADSGEDSDVY